MKFPGNFDKPTQFAFALKDGKLFTDEKDVPKDAIVYFELIEINDMPILRYAYAQAYFRELGNSITKELLLEYLNAIESIINKPQINLVGVIKLLTQLREHTELVFEPDAFYKLCSVIFFDESENPYTYSGKKGLEKMKLFKECENMAFFLSIPIKRYLPFTNMSENDLQDYLEKYQKVRETENLLLQESSKT
jgi:hypothetical protein